MTAGAVAVPTIVPLRAPVPGKHKTYIDSNTKIELNSGINSGMSLNTSLMQFDQVFITHELF